MGDAIMNTPSEAAGRGRSATAPARNFIVVGAGKELAVQVLLAIHGFADANCVVVCANGARSLRMSNLCSTCLEADFRGKDDAWFIDTVNRFADATPDIVLVPSDCEGARMTNRVRDWLKAAIVPTPDSSMLDCFDDKWRFYQFCRKHGLSVPPARLVRSKHDLDFASMASEMGIPFVVKPVDQQASNGVHIISGEDDYCHNILGNDDFQYAPLMVQRYIKGADVGLDLLSVRGKVTAIAIQRRDYPQHAGARMRFIANKDLEGIAHTICQVSSYDGVMNVDARIEEGSGEVFLLESNPRFWRSLSASVWCGLNFVAESVSPSQSQDQIRTLTSGYADTYYHPVFCPLLWPYAAFDFGHKGRLARRMLCDVGTLATQSRGAGRRIKAMCGRLFVTLAPR